MTQLPSLAFNTFALGVPSVFAVFVNAGDMQLMNQVVSSVSVLGLCPLLHFVSLYQPVLSLKDLSNLPLIRKGSEVVYYLKILFLVLTIVRIWCLVIHMQCVIKFFFHNFELL